MAGIICHLKPPSKHWTDRVKGWFQKEEKPDTDTRKLDAWSGYPKLAAFQTSQPQFSLYRSFNYLYGRTLLELQHELTTLEKQLDACDIFDSTNRKDLLASIRKDIKHDAANAQSAAGGQHYAAASPPGSPHPGTPQSSANPASWSHPASWTQPPIPMQPLSSSPPSPSPGTPTQHQSPFPHTSSMQGPPYRRREVIEDLKKKLKDYGELLIVAREVTAFQKPSSRDYESVRTWLSEKRPITEKEAEIFKKKEDLVTLHRGREWAKFDGFFVNAMLHFPFMQKWLKTPELDAKTDDVAVKLFDNLRVEAITSSIMTFVLCFLLVIPIVAMYVLNVSKSGAAVVASVVVLVAFVLLFTLAMPLFTKAGRNEMFAASAAYCAVLVVFISNFSSNQ